MPDTIVYAPADLQRDVAERLAGMAVSVKVSHTGDPASSSVHKHGKVIVVVSPKGGSGKTTIAANLAAALAIRFPGQVAALDLDVQFGDMCTSMGLHPEHNLAEVATSAQVDATTIKLFLTPYDRGLYVLCGARTPAEADVVTQDHVSLVIPLLAQDFEYVVVDTPAGLDDRTLAALEHATDLLLVSSLDVTSIRSLRKAVDAMDALNVTKQRHFVVNRADAKVGITLADAAEAVGWPIKGVIPSSSEIPLSMNLGTPIVKLEPRSAPAKKLVQLTDLFASDTGRSPEVEKPRRRLFPRAR
jgi:pilus assembly protein CpaE